MIRKILYFGMTLILVLYVQANGYVDVNNKRYNNEWKSLFDGEDASRHWTSVTGSGFPKAGWRVYGNELQLLPGRKGGDIITKQVFSNFELELEFKLDKNTNTGVKYLVSPLHTKEGKVEMNGLEYQMIDDEHHESVKNGISPKTETASAYLLYAPIRTKVMYGYGRWNKAKIKVQDTKISHWLNGELVLEFERGTPAFRQLVSETKSAQYSSRYGEAEYGHIMLTDHHDGASFRNIRIRELK